MRLTNKRVFFCVAIEGRKYKRGMHIPGYGRIASFSWGIQPEVVGRNGRRCIFVNFPDDIAIPITAIDSRHVS